MTDWHTSELSFLGRPRQISLRLAKVVIHILLELSAPLAFSVMAEYQPEEIGISENGARMVHEDGDHTTTEGYKRKIGDRKAVPST